MEAISVAISIKVFLERSDIAGEIPVDGWGFATYETFSKSRFVWKCKLNKGDNLLPRLNICGRPIANKYREGKLKSTLERESIRTWNRQGWRDGRQCNVTDHWSCTSFLWSFSLFSNSWEFGSELFCKSLDFGLWLERRSSGSILMLLCLLSKVRKVLLASRFCFIEIDLAELAF